MRQLILPIDGRTPLVTDVPAPRPGPGQVLIANRWSLISAGTERSTLELARQSLLQKARSRPDQVRRVLEKVRDEGVIGTLEQVRARLAQPVPLGYSAAGIVLEVGAEVHDLEVGDAVVSNGPHAEIVAVPRNLVSRVPEQVPLDVAAYAVVGSIALQGTRLAKVGVGDVVAVIGLGLVGQLAVAILKSAGCVVLGTDPDRSKQALALRMGADVVSDSGQFEPEVRRLSDGAGADAVLVAASTAAQQPLELATQVSRGKGRVVLVGAVGMHVPRREFYFKELELVVSRSYGPGRYDPRYEEEGIDYPREYVRWTLSRNFAAVLGLMASGRLRVSELTTHRFPLEQAPEAYQLIETGSTPYLGILLEYPEKATVRRRIEVPARVPRGFTIAMSPSADGAIGVSVVGAGSFAASTLLPLLVRSRDMRPRGLVSAKGLSARTLAERHGFAFAGSDFADVLADEATAAVIIATRHDTHTPMALAALRAGKHVFVEKPLAITEEEVDQWRDYVAESAADRPILLVGFNRRFSPAVKLLRQQFEGVNAARTISIRFNAGAVPDDHWAKSRAQGGGRLVGEGCHAVDLATYLSGAPVVRVYSTSASDSQGPRDDESIVVLDHANGSISTIVYTAAGDRAAGKERIEVSAGGITAVLDGLRRLDVYRQGRRRMRKRWWTQQKGYREQWEAFRSAVRSGQPPVPLGEIVRVTAATVRARDAINIGGPLEVF